MYRFVRSFTEIWLQIWMKFWKILYMELIIKYGNYTQDIENGVHHTETQAAKLEALKFEPST